MFNDWVFSVKNTSLGDIMTVQCFRCFKLVDQSNARVISNGEIVGLYCC